MHISKEFIDDTVTSWGLSNLQDVTVDIEVRELKTLTGYFSTLFKKDARPADLLFTAKAFSAGKELAVVEISINESSKSLETKLKELLLKLDTVIGNRKIIEG